MRKRLKTGDNGSRDGGSDGKLGDKNRDRRRREVIMNFEQDFNREDFDAAAWADNLFVTYDRDRTRTVCTGLNAKRNAAAAQMKESVFLNHGKLLETSKTVEKLDSDLEAIRESTRFQLSQVCHLTDITAPGSSAMLLLATVLDASSQGRPRLGRTSTSSDLSELSTDGKSNAKSIADAHIKMKRVEESYGRDVEWLISLPGKLQIARAKHDYDSAVTYLNQLRDKLGSRVTLQRALAGTQLEADINREQNLILRLLVHDARCVNSAMPTNGRKALALLDELGLGAVAQAAFLDAWSQRLSDDVLGSRGAQFDGDVLRYVGHVSGSFFAALSDAINECLILFDNGTATSRLADWASTEILRFCKSLTQRALFSETPDVIVRSAELLIFHSHRLLPPGFDLSFVIQQHFPQVTSAVVADACASDNDRSLTKL